MPIALPTPGDFDTWEREKQRPRHVGWIQRTEQCPDGRHLFDVIESTVEHVIEDESANYGERYEQDFRARLTCVRCGIVRAWEGRRTDDRHVATLAPEPLVAGDLVAQMVHSDRVGSQDWSRYDVFGSGPDGLELVGRLTPGRGTRGREYVIGTLEAWPQGQHVDGKDAIAALRKLSRARTTAP